MKTERDRQEIIDKINAILQYAYDSTLDEVYTLLQHIEMEEEENDLKAYNAAKSDIDTNDTFSWEDIKKEIANERKKDVV